MTIRKLAIAMVMLPLAARAANTTVSIVFNGPTSTSVACVNKGPFTIPVAAGMTLATCTVLPSSWSGALTLSGGPAGIVLSGTNIVVGAAAYGTAGTVNLTVTATP